MYTALSSLEEGQVKNDINKIEKHICRFCLDAQKKPTLNYFSVFLMVQLCTLYRFSPLLYYILMTDKNSVCGASWILILYRIAAYIYLTLQFSIHLTVGSSL